MEFIHLTAVIFMSFIAAVTDSDSFAVVMIMKILPALLSAAMFFDVLTQWRVI